MKNKSYKIIILFIFSACVIFFLYKFVIAKNSTRENYLFCKTDKGFQLSQACPDKHNSITLRIGEFECKKSSTWFSGLIAVNLLKNGNISDKVKIRLEFTNESHGAIPLSIECRKFGNEKYDKYCTGKDDNIIFVPDEGFSHRQYPLDNYELGIILGFATKEIADSVDKIIISNRTDSFNFKGEPTIGIENNKIAIKGIKTVRETLLHVFYYTFAGFILLFMIILWFVEKITDLAITLSAVFFSIFSIRNVVDKDIKIFPTLLDYVIIGSLLYFTILLLIQLIRIAKKGQKAKGK